MCHTRDQGNNNIVMNTNVCETIMQSIFTQSHSTVESNSTVVRFVGTSIETGPRLLTWMIQ